MRESPQSWRKPRSWLAEQAKLGPVATQFLSGAPDCPALQHVPKGPWRCSCGVAAPSTLAVFLSGLLLSVHHSQLQLPGGQKERAV